MRKSNQEIANWLMMGIYMHRRNFREGQFYHLFNKSIANYGIFKNDGNKNRFLITIGYYNSIKPKLSLSVFLRNKGIQKDLFAIEPDAVVKTIAYCIMPDHYHLLLKVLKNNQLSKYINDVENSYTRFLNTKLKRKGPLWQSNFKTVRVCSENQLLHVSRYIHLNPVTNFLVNKPEDWQYSSYKYFLDKNVIKNYLTEISIINPEQYKEFVEDRIDYQRKLRRIKKHILY